MRRLVLGLIIVLVASACSGGGDEDSAPPSPTISPRGGTSSDGSSSGGSSNGGSGNPSTPTADFGEYAAVEPLACTSLLRQDEIDEALGVWDRPDGEQNSRSSARGEHCTEKLVSDERVFVSIEPGDPSDFEGGRLLGVRGDPVDSIGDAAVWFGGPQAENGGTGGVLSVRQDTPVGVLYFRIGLGRPDLSVSEQIEAARTLASRALPRFPGMESAAAEVPVVDLCELLTAEEAQAVLDPYQDVHPATFDEVLGGESPQVVDLRDSDDDKCQYLILAEVYVEAQQGSTDDFVAGASMEGIGGESVPGIGDDAVWYPGVPFQGQWAAPHEQGILSVRYRDATFRIVLAVPDTPHADQLNIVTPLARRALERLPGYVPEAVASEFDDTIEDGIADASNISFVDNLLAREEDGEWDRGAGLVATLQLLTGDADASSVLRHGDVLESEGTGIIAMAYEYLEDGTDVSAKAEIAALLDRLVFTNDELELMAGITGAADTQAAPASAVLVSFPLAQTPNQSVDGCSEFFNSDIYGTTPGIGPCLEWRPGEISADLDGKYRLFVPAPSWPQAGWTNADYDLALQALEVSAAAFESDINPIAKAAGAPGRMPPVNVVFSVTPSGPRTLAHATPVPGRPCGIALFPLMQTVDLGKFQQTIAHELAHCFQRENFPDQNKVDYEFIRWREEGLAEHLSNVVYPQLNTEHDWRVELARMGRRTTVHDLSYGNFLFFQYLENKIGVEGIFELVRTLPTSGGRQSQWEALSQYPDMKNLFREYVEGMIDGSVEDTGGGSVPFKLPYRVRSVDGPFTLKKFIVPFGLYRIRLTVGDCKLAVTSTDVGDAINTSRQESAAAWHPLPGQIPSSDTDPHDRIFVIAAIDQADVTFGVSELKDDPTCEDDDGGSNPDPPSICLTCGPSEYYRKKG